MRTRSLNRLFPRVLVALALAAAGASACGDDGHAVDHAKMHGGAGAPAPAGQGGGAHGHGAGTGAHEDPAAHTDHGGRAGGVVLMNGDLHLEVVLDPGGKHRLYLTDAVRKPLPASAIADVKITIKRAAGAAEEIAATPDPTGAHWVADGRSVDDPAATARIAYRFGGKDEFIEVSMPEPAGGPVSGPHGGQLQLLGDGKVELLVDARTGLFKVWVLDRDHKVLPVDGLSGHVKVGLAGYPAELALAAAGTRLEATGPAITADHAPAELVIDAGGMSRSARFSLHFEPGTP